MRRLVGGVLSSLIVVTGPAISTQGGYRVTETPSGKRGATTNVVVELVLMKGELYRRITTLARATFAVRPLSEGRGSSLSYKSPTGGIVDVMVPNLSAGDRHLEVRIDPAVGFSEVGGLKLLDPAVLSIASDGTIDADKAGVRARVFQGTSSHADCFLSVAQSTDGSFSIGAFSKPEQAADGSMVRVAGEAMTCRLRLDGKDGENVISKPVAAGGRTRFLFLPEAK